MAGARIRDTPQVKRARPLDLEMCEGTTRARPPEASLATLPIHWVWSAPSTGAPLIRLRIRRIECAYRGEDEPLDECTPDSSDFGISEDGDPYIDEVNPENSDRCDTCDGPLDKEWSRDGYVFLCDACARA